MEIESISPRLNRLESRVRDIEAIAGGAFQRPDDVLADVKAGLKGSANPERMLSRYFAIFDTLFRQRVFKDNDEAWPKLRDLARPEVGDWGNTPSGLGYAVFGLALRASGNPEGMLDTLKALSQTAPQESRNSVLRDVPRESRMVYYMAAHWSETQTLGLPENAPGIDNYYPDHGAIKAGLEKAAMTLKACQNPIMAQVMGDRAKSEGDEGARKFDNALLWEAFIKGITEAPQVAELLLAYKADEAAGRCPSSFNRAVNFLERPGVQGASIDIDPGIGFLLVEEIGSGHSQMLTDYGVSEENKGRFLPGAITLAKDTGLPVVQITGGLQHTARVEAENNLQLACNHLLRWGFGGNIDLIAYVGAPEALRSTIGELSRGVDMQTIRKERVSIREVKGLGDLSEQGYLVVDEKDTVHDLQGGSVIVAPVQVLAYCYYYKSGDAVRLYNIKAKHFEISSDSVKVAQKLRAALGDEGKDKVVATGEHLKRS